MNQSTLSKNIACTSNIDYNKVIQLRTIGNNPSNPIPPVTTTVGRVTGQNLTFTDPDMYEDYKMRRKVAVLQNNAPGRVLSKKELYSRMSKVRGSSELSQHAIKNFSSEDCQEIAVLFAPTFSGVNDILFPGYRLDRSIPVYRSL